jgi:D-inositol-3-phosphate glycosyltransferase
VPHGVDRGRFSPGDRTVARAALGVTHRHVLAFVGRLQPLKAPDVAVLTLAELRRRRPDLDVELLVVGGASGNGGGEPARLHRLAATNGVADRVRFLAPQPHDRLATIYRAADLVLMPSWSESFGLVALEAQACGTPVVAAGVGGLLHAVGDGTTGALLANHQPDCWADTVAQLLSNPRRLAAMGAAAARFAGANGWDRAAAHLLEIYGDLVREPVLEQMG